MSRVIASDLKNKGDLHEGEPAITSEGLYDLPEADDGTIDR